MPLITFKPQFEDLIRARKKRSTIRKQGKKPGPRARPADLFHLYSGRYTMPDYHKIGIARVDHIMRVQLCLEKGQPILWLAGYDNPEEAPYYTARSYELELILAKEGFSEIGVEPTPDERKAFFDFFELEKNGEFNGWLYDFTLIEEAPPYEG